MAEIVTELDRDFAARLRAVRQSRGMSCVRFGEFLGIGAGVASSWEACRRMPPMSRADTAVRKLGYSGLIDFLTACRTCMNQPHPGTVCGACGLPETPKTKLLPAEIRAYARLRETILGGAA